MSEELNQKIAEKAAALGMKPFNPIGECFDSAMHQIAFGEDPTADVMLIHGIGVSNAPGQEGNKIKHAWLEWTDVDGNKVAYDSTWGILAPADVYRKYLKVSYSVSYTKSQAMDLWQLHDYPGPWDPLVKAIGK